MIFEAFSYFFRFSEQHKFAKPNDERAIRLMNECAAGVLTSFSDVILGYGQSDEYSFVFKRQSETYNRRARYVIALYITVVPNKICGSRGVVAERNYGDMFAKFCGFS